MAGVVYVNDSGTWKAMNFDSTRNVYVNDAGTWKSLNTSTRGIHIKDGGVWKKVYPSLNTTWTTAKTPGTAIAGGYAVPIFDTDPLYQVDNLATATDEVRWKDTATTAQGQLAKGTAYGWSDNILGAHYGAVDRLEITFDAAWIDAPVFVSGDYFKMQSELYTSSAKQTGELQGTFTSYTFDYDMSSAGWNISDTVAGDIYDGTQYASVRAYYNNPSSASDARTAVKAFKVRLKYKHV